MRLIELGGKHAVGPYRFAMVDDADFDALNQHRWKAKPNADGNNVYAVRNVTRADGRYTTLRMHRIVCGLEQGNPREPDHRDHNGVNNQRDNLRIVSRSVNIASARRIVLSFECVECRARACELVPAFVRQKLYCTDGCKQAAAYRRQRQRRHVSGSLQTVSHQRLAEPRKSARVANSTICNS